MPKGTLTVYKIHDGHLLPIGKGLPGVADNAPRPAHDEASVWRAHHDARDLHTTRVGCSVRALAQKRGLSVYDMVLADCPSMVRMGAEAHK